MEHGVQGADARPVDRKWPLLATLTFAGILTFWGVYSYEVRSRQSAVNADSGPSAAYALKGKAAHPVHFQQPSGPPSVVVGTHPITGNDVQASCTTCHSTRVASRTNGVETPLDDFHVGLTFQHGNGTLSCFACHNPADYDTLRSAAGDAIPFTDVVRLCAQCHSSQNEDYEHGAHGGMNGYWDLSQGPRTRHNCIDCHDPHAPAFPRMRPTFKPYDRGLTPAPTEPAHGSGGPHE